MTKTNVSADRAVDTLYADLRGRFGSSNARANGYLSEGYFRGEQRLLFKLLDDNASILVDVACGSGLMVQPLLDRRERVIGIDFNVDACQAALENGLTVVRGDAFALPLVADSVDEIVSCQFFNQQRADAVRQFIVECARVLRPGGRLIMVWRNGDAWVHRFALMVFGLTDRVLGRPIFPYENHPWSAIEAYAADSGLKFALRAVSFPPLAWQTSAIGSPLAQLIGASNICVLERPT